MNKSKKPKQKIRTVLNDKGRRHWDTSNIMTKVEIPSETKKEEKKFPPVEEREFLKSHDNIDLEKNIGKSVIINSQTPKEEQGGYYCQTCDSLLKDSAAYLDHLNGKKHNRMLGMNMKVEKVSVDKVKEHLLNIKRQQDKPILTFEDLEKRLEDQEMQEKLEKEKKKQMKKMKKSSVNN